MMRLGQRSLLLSFVFAASTGWTAGAHAQDGCGQNRAGGSAPPISSVVQAALRHAALNRDRVESAVRRARLSGLLPTLRVALRRGTALDASLTAGTTDRSNISRDQDLTLEASLGFELGRLLFAREEVSLLRVERTMELDRQSLVAEVVRVYFERRRLLREVRSGLGGPQERARATMEAEHHRALLNAWTDNVFAGCWQPH